MLRAADPTNASVNGANLDHRTFCVTFVSPAEELSTAGLVLPDRLHIIRLAQGKELLPGSDLSDAPGGRRHRDRSWHRANPPTVAAAGDNPATTARRTVVCPPTGSDFLP